MQRRSAQPPKKDAKGWTAKANVVAIKDATPLLTKLKFASGKGVAAGPGKLGMALQTPRQLTGEDVALLDALIGSSTPAKAKGSAKAATKPAPAGKASSAGSDGALPIDDHLTELEDQLGESEDDLVEVHPSSFAKHAAAWEALERRLGRPLPPDLRRFYERCDGFTDNRYTRIDGISKFLKKTGQALGQAGHLKIATVGDGSGLDGKSIELVLGDAFDGGDPMFVFHDYLMDFDVKALHRFRRRVVAPVRAAFEAQFPLWLAGDGTTVDQDEAELVNYGPVTMTELIDYVLETAAQV